MRNDAIGWTGANCAECFESSLPTSDDNSSIGPNQKHNNCDNNNYNVTMTERAPGGKI